MAELPKQTNCPIKSDDGICMCAAKRCEWIDLDDCFRMRSAYFYGFNTAESIAINNLDRIKEKIDCLFNKVDDKEDGEVSRMADYTERVEGFQIRDVTYFFSSML